MSWICPIKHLNDDNYKAKLDILDTFGDDVVEDLESKLLDENVLDGEMRLFSGGDQLLQHNVTWFEQHRDLGIPDSRYTIPTYDFDCIERHVVTS